MTEKEVFGKIEPYAGTLRKKERWKNMKLIRHLLCFCLILGILCPLCASCGGELAPLTASVSEGASSADEEVKPIAYPCETDPDFCTESLTYACLKPEELSALPVATDGTSKTELRKLCLDFFQMQLSFLWQTNLDVLDYIPTFYNFKDDSRALRKENYYAGIPYQAGGYGNLYRVMEYYDPQTGILDLQRAFAEYGGYGEGGEVSSVETDASGNVTYHRYRSMRTFFNQCSSGSSWAWGRVINSVDFGSTADINVSSGFIPVGCFTYQGMENIDRFGEVTEKNPTAFDTKNVIEQLGSGGVSHCYALMRPADCLVSTGHVMMVKKVKLVRRADGTPDPARSTVVTLEQIENWGEKTEFNGKKLYRQGGVDRVYTFEELIGSGYIPFTFAEFLDENDPFDQPHLAFYRKYIAPRKIVDSRYNENFGFTEEAVDEMSGAAVEKARIFLSGEWTSLDELEKLSVGSNYSISDIFVRVKGEDGTVLAENVYRSMGTRIRSVPLSSPVSNASGERPPLLSGVAEALAKGGKLEISVRVSTGELLYMENLNF